MFHQFCCNWQHGIGFTMCRDTKGYFLQSPPFSPYAIPNNSANAPFGGIAIPHSISQSRRSVSPGLIPKISRACFGITICSFSPALAVHTYFPSGAFIFFYLIFTKMTIEPRKRLFYMGLYFLCTHGKKFAGLLIFHLLFWVAHFLSVKIELQKAENTTAFPAFFQDIY